jgi:hypothetical protein
LDQLYVRDHPKSNFWRAITGNPNPPFIKGADNLSFVFDHRILDAASADWFLAKVKETLENWS